MKDEHRLKAVLDTNIWISAALSQSGAPAAVVRQVLQNGVPVFSAATFRELETRLWKPKFDRYLDMATCSTASTPGPGWPCSGPLP